MRSVEGWDEITFYVKLPAWFKVRTPIGDYNPDWGIVMEQRDQFGDRGETLYLIRETKGSTTMGDLYQAEQQKIHCGRRHFNGALGVNYDVLKSADELP